MTRPVPHDLDAERHLLGAMLLGSTPIVAVLPIVTSADFHRPAHATIFDAIVTLHGNGRDANHISVRDHLRAAGTLEGIGGDSTLTDLLSGTPSTSAAATYAQVVANLRAARRLIDVGSQLVELGYQAGDIGDAVDTGHTLLGEVEVADAVLPSGLVPLDDFLDRPASARSPWVVKGLMRQDWRAVIVASEGSGKSMSLRQIAMLPAQGIHPFSFDPIDKVTSLIVDLENPDDGIEHGCSMIRSTAMRGAYERNRTYLWSHRQGLNLRTRADRATFDRVLTHVRPDLVVMGPLNKMFQRGRDTDEQAASEVQVVLDDLRTRHRFALLIEHHAPKGQGGMQREMIPFGSQRWQSWPELGITMRTEGEYGDVRLGRFRGDRLPAHWPDVLSRGGKGTYPWVGTWETGMTFEEGAA